jgi:hypothetical protein
MRHESYGRRTIHVVVCVASLIAGIGHELSSLARTLESWVESHLRHGYLRVLILC